MARPVELAAELAAATAAVRRKHLLDLSSRYGIPMSTIMERIGVCRVRVEGDHYVLDAYGIEMVIVACFKAPPRLRDGRWRAPSEIIDLIAFDPAAPGRWWTRCGLVAALGEEMLSEFSDDLVRIWRSPLAWLKAGAVGICPVSPDPVAVRDVLIRLPDIVPEDLAHGREIRRLLMQDWTRKPKIHIAETTLVGGA